MQGYILRGLKFMNVTKAHAEQHYADLASKPFFGGEQEGVGGKEGWVCWSKGLATGWHHTEQAMVRGRVMS